MVRFCIALSFQLLVLAGCGGAAPEPKDASNEASKTEPKEEPKAETTGEAESSSTSESKPAEESGEKRLEEGHRGRFPP